MDIGKALSNPYVLAGGVAVGAILLFMGSSGGSSPDHDSSRNALFGYLADLNKNSVAIENARLSYQARQADGFRSLMVNMIGAGYDRDVKMHEIDASISKTHMVTLAARDADIRANETRLKLAKVDYDIARHGNKTARAIARLQTKADIATAKSAGKAAVKMARWDYRTASAEIDASRQTAILDNLVKFGGLFLPGV